METPEEKANKMWLALQDTLMQGAYHTVKGVITEKEEGNPEAYFELARLLKDFAVRKRDVLESKANAKN